MERSELSMQFRRLILIISLIGSLSLLNNFLPSTLAQSTLKLPPELTRSLSFGSRGALVRALQEYLAQNPAVYPEGLVTGFFGNLTKLAVQRFQTKYSITPVGIVGPLTRAKLRELRQTLLAQASPSPTPSPSPSPAESPMSSESPSPPPSSPSPSPNPLALIKTGTGIVSENQYFQVGPAEFLYSGSYGYEGRGYLSPGSTTPASVANVAPSSYSSCENINAKGYSGITNICQFTNPSLYAFTTHNDYVRVYDKTASEVQTSTNTVVYCYQGILLFKHGAVYGAIDPEDVDYDNKLHYRYWYDESGGTNFSALCSTPSN